MYGKGAAMYYGPPRLYGVLCKWNGATACGFIERSDGTGKRLFAHKSEFVEQFADGQEPPVGTPVSFFPGIDQKSGKDRATAIQVEYPASSLQYGAPRLCGTLTEWNPQRACGFLECPDQPGKKFFAHKSEFVQQFDDGDMPPVGTPMSFVLGIDTKSGKQRAQDIRSPEDGGYDAHEPERLYGTLDDWNSVKACGFIHCLDVQGKKMFAHKSEFAEPFADGDEPPIGTQVSFIPGLDAKSGKERAQDIRIEVEMPQVFHGPPRLYGTLKEWKGQKACGFIECLDPPGKRLFAHKSEFTEPFADEAGPALGTKLSFTLGIDQKSGKERAQDIQVEQGRKRELQLDASTKVPLRKRRM